MNSHSVVGLLLFFRGRYRVLSGVGSYGFMPARSRFSSGETSPRPLFEPKFDDDRNLIVFCCRQRQRRYDIGGSTA